MSFLSIGNLLGGGIVPDQPAHELPPNVFTDGLNIDYTSEGIRPSLKEVEVFPTMLDNPLYLVKVKLGAGVDGWVYGSLKGLYIIYQGAHYDITRSLGDGGAYTAKEDLGWQEAILHGIPILNNGFDIPQQLDPASPTAKATNLANWPSGIFTEVIRPYKNYLIALRINKGGGVYDQQSILWSDPADPGTVPPSWDYTDPTTQAGLYTFTETDDRLIDGLVLGDEFIVYKERSIYAMRFIGGAFIFSIKRRPGDIGLLTVDAVVSFPGGHFFVGQDDFYVYSGNGLPQSVGAGRVRNKILKTVTSGQKNKIFVKHDSTSKAIYVYYPSDGSLWANRIAVWKYETDVWSFRQAPNVSSATFGEVDSIAPASWDSLGGPWGGEIIWEETEEVWNNASGDWLQVVAGDEGSWASDNTIWDVEQTWDDTQGHWDLTNFEPITENMVMATYTTGAGSYDPLNNTSVVDGVSWIGDSTYPPLWLIPSEGAHYKGYLERKGLAITGKDHRGAWEVNRTVRKILTECYPELDFGKVAFRFGSHDTPTSAVEWGETWLFDEALDLKVDPFVSGKFLAVEIQGAGEGNDNWLLSGYGLEINTGGRY